MAKEYIERSDALALETFMQDADGFEHSCVLSVDIRSCPPADVVEVVHGRWIVTKEYNDVIDMDVVKYTCSACGEYRLSATTLSQATNYCPNCGARMDGEG